MLRAIGPYRLYSQLRIHTSNPWLQIRATYMKWNIQPYITLLDAHNNKLLQSKTAKHKVGDGGGGWVMGRDITWFNSTMPKTCSTVTNLGKDILNSYSASHGNWCTATLWNRIMTVQCEGMGEVGSARYKPSLLPPCPSIRALNYSNCQRSTHSNIRAWQFKCYNYQKTPPSAIP